jgi:hypothetical protein
MKTHWPAGGILSFFIQLENADCQMPEQFCKALVVNPPRPISADARLPGTKRPARNQRRELDIYSQ